MVIEINVIKGFERMTSDYRIVFGAVRSSGHTLADLLLNAKIETIAYSKKLDTKVKESVIHLTDLPEKYLKIVHIAIIKEYEYLQEDKNAAHH